MIVRVVDFDYPFWFNGFSSFGDRKWAWPKINGNGLILLLEALDVTSRVKLHQTVQVVINCPRQV